MAVNKSSGCATVIIVLLALLLIVSIAKTTAGAISLVILAGFVTVIVVRARQKTRNSSRKLSSPPSGSVPLIDVCDRIQSGTWTTCENPELRKSLVQKPVIAHSEDTDQYWIPKGKIIQIAGYMIPYGMIYVGSGMKAAWTSRIEPALINPRLKVDTASADYTIRSLDYWPSYSEASPAARASYLLWLSEGMPNRRPDPGYIFLYFYGLERRALHDSLSSNTAEIEIPEIERSIGWLMNVSRENESVRRYGRSLLDFLAAKRQLVPSLEAPIIHPYRYGLGLEFSLRIGIGHIAMNEVALPSDWALAWFLSARTSRIGTAIRKCPQEFAEIFKSEYQKAFGSGIVLPKAKIMLKAQHKTASTSFGQEVVSVDAHVPDVCILGEPLKLIQSVGESAATKLQSFSRALGSKTTIRKRDRGAVPEVQAEAYLLLPTILWPQEKQQAVSMIRDSLSDSSPFKTMPAAELLSVLGCSEFTKGTYEAITKGLNDNAIGIEPDTRYGGRLPETQAMIVLFSLPKQEEGVHSIESYSSGAVAIQLAAAAAIADGDFGHQEQKTMLEHLESWLHLSNADLARLKAKLELFKVESPKLTGLKKKLDALDPITKSTLGDFMVRIVKADGIVTPVEVKVLEKVFSLLGLGAQDLYGRLHGVASEPVSIKPGIPTSSGYAIPQPTVQSALSEVALDMDRVEALKADSARAALLLGAVFAEDKDEPATGVSNESVECPDESQRLLNLDLEHSQLLAVLLSRAEWSREEIGEICQDRGLMMEGAIERINEAAFELVQQAIIEGDDPLEVRQDLLSEAVA